MIPYKLIRSARKTIAIQITPAGEVIVRCPNRMPTEAVDKFVAGKAQWLEKHLAKYREKPNLPSFSPEELRDLIRQAKTLIPERVAYYAPKVGVTYGRIAIRSQHSRWGSCSSKGNLNFNCLLMLTPPEVLDYVVVHELCHRKEMNHSPRFWEEVEKVLPGYGVQKKWLKEQGGSLIGRLKPMEKILRK